MKKGASRVTVRNRGRLVAGYLIGWVVSVAGSYGAVYIFGDLRPFPHLLAVSIEEVTAYWVWLVPSCLVGAATSLVISHSPSQWRQMGLPGVSRRLLTRTLTFAAAALVLQAVALATAILFYGTEVFN